MIYTAPPLLRAVLSGLASVSDADVMGASPSGRNYWGSLWAASERPVTRMSMSYTSGVRGDPGARRGNYGSIVC